MKKILVAFAAVAFAAVAQAASINWAVGANSWTLADGTKAAKGTTVYLIDAASWSTIETSILAGTTSFTTSDTGVLAVGATSNTKGQILSNTATSTQLTAGTSYNFAYLVIDGDNYFASATKTQAAYDTSDPVYSEVNSITFDAATFTSTSGLTGGTWQSSAAVPEPTSALLLLLGVAGVALRRKQA